MECPYCGHPETRFVKGRQRSLVTGVPRYQRRRECPECGRRFCTIETVVSVDRDCRAAHMATDTPLA